MKRNVTTLVILLLLWSLAFFGSLIGTAYFVILPRIQLPELPPLPPPPPPKIAIVDRDIPHTARTMQQLDDVAEEMDLWQKELLKRQTDVARREKELESREILLKAESAKVEKTRNEVLDLQKQLDAKFITVDEKDKAHYEDLGKLFEKMTLTDAVDFIAVYPDAELVKLLPKIKQKQRIKIFELWGQKSDEQRKRAVRLADQIRYLDEQPAPSAAPAQPPAAPAPAPTPTSSQPVADSGTPTRTP